MVPLPKPRNPVAVAARQRQGGVHEKTEKAKRQNARQALQKAIKHGRDDFSPFLRTWISQRILAKMAAMY